MKDAERFAIFARRANFFGEGDFRFALKNCQRRAQLVRSVSDEAALAFECCVEAFEKAIESCGEAAEFIVRILDWQGIVNGGFADVIGLRGDVRDGSKGLARHEIATGRGKKNWEWNRPTERDAESFKA